MRNAETKLAEWHLLYQQLAQAQAQLVASVLAPGEEAERLRARIDRLQIECEAALQALHAAVARVKAQPAMRPVRDS